MICFAEMSDVAGFDKVKQNEMNQRDALQAYLVLAKNSKCKKVNV